MATQDYTPHHDPLPPPKRKILDDDADLLLDSDLIGDVTEPIVTDSLVLAERWWAPVLRGMAAIVFGILTLVSPLAGLAALVTLFGAYALVDGILSFVAAASDGRRWGWFLLEGVVGVATALLAFFWPGITVTALVFLVAIWAVSTGATEIASAIRLRKIIKDEWLLALSGVLSIGLGLALALYPMVGALVVTLWIAGYALAFGALLVALGFRLRAWQRRAATAV
jgi:uncharacterized membrane protein HdeD (DUF308 family)